ncbi:MAG: hypothetical protein ABR503_07535 [Chitinophagaceae bacterium]
MWSEELNKKIKQASEHHIPEYDESAWTKMEALLNKHLHIKKDGRRKMLYIFFPLILIVSGALLLNKDRGMTLSENDLKTPGEKFIVADEKKLNNKNTFSSKDSKSMKNFYFNPPGKERETFFAGTYKKKSAGQEQKQTDFRINKINEGFAPVTKNFKSIQLPNENKMQDKFDLNVEIQDKKPITLPVILPEQSKMDSLAEDVPSTGVRKAKNKNLFSRFDFSASAGPDISGVGLNDLGKTKIRYGAGIGYKIGKRFSIRSGLYAANKIYSSPPGDYNPPTGYWTYNVDLKRVDADCKVYEIPLNVYYSFKQKRHHHWFASLGASSYLMKKETYHYLYKTQTGNYLYRGWTLKNKNKHYFSVINFSGGYSHQFNKTFSVMAEPYIKIPIDGVGFGKVKLKSTGVLFTLSAAPF